MPPSASSRSIRAGSAQSNTSCCPRRSTSLLAATADEPASLEFSSPKDLFDRFYDRKERYCRRRRDPAEVRFNAVIARLAERMSAEQQLSLPRSVLDADDLRRDADGLASEHVITFDRGKVAFFHEAFFDYSFARGWVAGGRELMAWLLDGDQELFRRGQVRQILTHLRRHRASAFHRGASRLPERRAGARSTSRT